MAEPTIDAARFEYSVRKLAMNVSVDVSSDDVRRTIGFAVTLPMKLETFVPWLPNTTSEAMILATESLRRSGLTPIPHVAARRLGSATEAFGLLAGLRSRGGVESVLLMTFIVSQFCFDGAAIAAWIKRLRARGIAVPVRIGVAGPAKLRKLLQIGLRCGVGGSLRALSHRIGSVARLFATHGPDDVLHDFVATIGGTSYLDRVALHVFAFGGIELTARWLARFRDGHFFLTKGGVIHV